MRVLQFQRHTNLYRTISHGSGRYPCLRAEQNGELSTAAEGLGLLIDLMREIDRCERDVIFFADEAGSWQVGVVWDRVLPAWFRSMSPTTDAHEWAETVADALNEFADYQMKDILAAAREAGTKEQKEALAEYESDLVRP